MSRTNNQQTIQKKKKKIDLGINMDDESRYAIDDIKEADWLKEFNSKQSD